MTRDLAAELVDYFTRVGQDTALNAARAIHARTSDVLHLVRSDSRFSGPLTGGSGRLYYSVAPLGSRGSAAFPCFSRPVTLRDGTDCARLYDALADGGWHSSSELQSLRMTVHSRISDLRLKHGCTVETMHDPQQERARAYLYRLVGTRPLTEGEGRSSRRSSSVSGPVLDERGFALSSTGPLQLTFGEAA